MIFGIDAPYVWLGIFILTLIVESATLSLTSVWFSAGALIAGLLALFTDSVTLQVALFVAVSGLCLFYMRPLTQKHITSKSVRTNADRVIGQAGHVIETINNLAATGQVTVGARQWTARTAEPDIIIPAGQTVRILSIEGVKLLVEPIPQATVSRIHQP